MDIAYYLDKFQKAVDGLDKQPFDNQQLELKVGVWVDSVVLKIQKQAWLGNPPMAIPFRSSVFFSVWISDELIKESKLYYNIHALKLRELKGYKIQSREFADAFRSKFNTFEKNWPNVSTKFGPLTLMEGWVKIDGDNFESTITGLTNKFLETAFIIDDLLAERQKVPER